MFMLAAAARGATAVFARETYGCPGGGVECFKYILSGGNDQWEQGRKPAEKVKPSLRAESHDNFVRGERCAKSPDMVRNWLDCLPIRDIDYEYVVFTPLSRIEENAEPKAVITLSDPDQISALTILANYDRDGNDNFITPYAAGCRNTAGSFLERHTWKELRKPAD